MRFRLLTLVLAATPALALAADHPVHDGKWEITTSTIIPGMGATPANVHTQCITKKDPVPKHDSPRAKNCKMSDQKITGSTVSWIMHCEGQSGPIEGTGEITYSGDSFDGNLKFKMTNPRSGAPMDVTTSMKGKRVGECD